VDEIHRFNKAQQDAFLPHVEDGTVILIGATTENPYFSVNAPLLSRARLFPFQALTEEEIGAVLDRALTDTERGLGHLSLTLAADARTFLIASANGDARNSLNALELAANLSGPSRTITLEVAEEAVGRRAIGYDKEGDAHYDIISAFIKSIRGSDPNASVYYLARMLEAGEDPRFIARRLVILASEDVGNADPSALPLAVAAFTGDREDRYARMRPEPVTDDALPGIRPEVKRLDCRAGKSDRRRALAAFLRSAKTPS
jgi:putative ATPase